MTEADLDAAISSFGREMSPALQDAVRGALLAELPAIRSELAHVDRELDDAADVAATHFALLALAASRALVAALNAAQS